MDFASRLRRLRAQKGLTQTELGKKLNLSKQTISSYENRGSSPDPETLEALADLFGVTLDYLLGRTKKPFNTRSSIDTLAAHRDDDPLADLPEEARRSVEEYIEFVRQKYAAKKEG